MRVALTRDFIKKIPDPDKQVDYRDTCQTAFKRDPRSASKRDPLFG